MLAPLLAVTLLAAPAADAAAPPLQVEVAELPAILAALKAPGAQAVLVNVWATWCEPCREELPALDRLRRELGPRGLEVYAVSFDEDRSQIPLFLEQTPVSLRILWDQGGDRYAAAYDVERLPTTLVVDRGGTIRFVHAGFEESTAAEQRREVEALLDEPDPRPERQPEAKP
jgi:thiol-disulfide isomerase/thioredoxin